MICGRASKATGFCRWPAARRRSSAADPGCSPYRDRVTSTAGALARWAHDLRPTGDDLALADRSLLDTVAVALAAREHPVTALAARLGEGGHWPAAAHLLDFDGLHRPS